jgi:hypothetical protein
MAALAKDRSLAKAEKQLPATPEAKEEPSQRKPADRDASEKASAGQPRSSWRRSLRRRPWLVAAVSIGFLGAVIAGILWWLHARQYETTDEPKYLMAAGLALIAIGMWHSTSLEQGASFGYFAWMRIFQVIGLPFLFVPISAVAYSGLRPESTGQASSLINVARNLGGSIGVSVANTELAQRSRFHQSRLVEATIPSSVNYQHTLERLTEFFVGQGSSLATAQRQAVGWIGQTIAGQSTLLSYIDVFWGCSMFALLMVPLALALKSVNPSQAAATSH